MTKYKLLISWLRIWSHAVYQNQLYMKTFDSAWPSFRG